jgi:hypothetical protein
MATNLPDITIDNVIDALGSFIELFSGAGTTIRGEVNRVAMPVEPLIVLTELMSSDLEIPLTDYQPAAGTATIQGPTKITIQADFYGDQGGDLCRAVKQAIRTGWGFDQFPANIRPLYSEDGRQVPFISGEQQYERRWILTIALQYGPTVTVPQQFANQAAASIITAADVTYKP